jgi:hypothetical protein
VLELFGYFDSELKCIGSKEFNALFTSGFFAAFTLKGGIWLSTVYAFHIRKNIPHSSAILKRRFPKIRERCNPL